MYVRTHNHVNKNIKARQTNKKYLKARPTILGNLIDILCAEKMGVGHIGVICFMP